MVWYYNTRTLFCSSSTFLKPIVLRYLRWKIETIKTQRHRHRQIHRELREAERNDKASAEKAAPNNLTKTTDFPDEQSVKAYMAGPHIEVVVDAL